MRRSRTKKRNILIMIFLVILLVGGITYYIVDGIPKLYSRIIIEAGSELPLASEFIIKSRYPVKYTNDISAIDTSKIGSYDIEISINKKTYNVIIEINDTIEPKAQIHDLTAWMDEEIKAEDFLTDLSDATDVKIYFKSTPIFSADGKQEISVLIEDEAHNMTELSANLILKRDIEAPVIEGVSDQIIFKDDIISYRKGVNVSDNRDVDINFTVDSSKVDTTKAGEYEVFYSAIDSFGNETKQTAIITVREMVKYKDRVVDIDYVNELADAILSEIIDEKMTDKEKLWAIFKWGKTHIAYTGHAQKDDWLLGAVQGMKKCSGDCFTYYASNRALLERAGYEVFPVKRVADSRAKHYWVLVKYDGGWYHFDTISLTAKYKFDCFLKTDAEVEAFTQEIWGLRKNFYTYDKTNCPKVATKVVER